jgi:DmsE family decaheme c-type cytochrome
MKLRSAIILVLSAICLCFAPQADAAKAQKATKAHKATKAPTGDVDKDAKFRLKPGARQKVCLTCHADFEERLKKAFVHTPIKTIGCTACHSPHASNYPKQLSADPSALCLTCHKDILPDDARSKHKAALEGKCVQCHDPHSSDNKFNLLKAGNELCFSCHKDKADAVSKARFKHNPVEKGCVNCHNPHASMKATALLIKEVPSLCKDCHQTDNALFIKQHLGYPVAGTRCTMCHSVHGSDKAGLIYNTAHPPFVNKTCNLCHEGPNSGKPLALKSKGFELCRGCHNTMVNEMFAKKRFHWPILGKDGCLNCHSPHASPQKGLLKDKPIVLCGRCHIDTIQRQERSITKHQPMQEGTCTVCHSPHASDNELLFTKPSTIELCAQCHDWQKHSTHPVGEKVIDKRNKNLTVQCLSCHRAHGTEYKHMLPAATVSELCTQCHVEYKR